MGRHQKLMASDELLLRPPLTSDRMAGSWNARCLAGRGGYSSTSMLGAGHPAKQCRVGLHPIENQTRKGYNTS